MCVVSDLIQGLTQSKRYAAALIPNLEMFFSFCNLSKFAVPSWKDSIVSKVS